MTAMASNLRARRHLPTAFTLLAALMLTMAPLPAAIEPFRPDWVALVLIYWAMSVPLSYGVGVAWLLGILLDVAQGTLLGQHALALCVVTYVTVKVHLLIRVFPLPQLTATVFALLALYRFLLFWINGVAGITAAPVVYWGPVVTGALLWPLVYLFLSGLRFRVASGR